jgi:hypothetical protein
MRTSGSFKYVKNEEFYLMTVNGLADLQFKTRTSDCPGEEHHPLTVQEVTEDVEISFGSCHIVLMEGLGMHRVSAEFMPRLLSDDQKQQ